MIPPPSIPQTTGTLESIRASQKVIRQTLALLLVGGILLATGTDIFLLRQVGMMRRQTEEVERFVRDYESNDLPVINRFVADLQAFARTNADFKPLLGRYITAEEAPKLNPPPIPPKGL